MNTSDDLRILLQQIRKLESASMVEGASANFLEVERSVSGEEVRINGNLQGLIYFARAVLEVASKGFDGAHQHFDEAVLDRCDVPLVVRFKPPEWGSVR